MNLPYDNSKKIKSNEKKKIVRDKDGNIIKKRKKNIHLDTNDNTVTTATGVSVTQNKKSSKSSSGGVLVINSNSKLNDTQHLVASSGGDRPRWSPQDTSGLVSMRRILHSELSKRQQMPDVVGDRRLLRFLKGHQYNIDKACKMFSKFLKWRDDNDVDNIRNDILYGNYKSLTEFPYASKIMSLVPQIILAYDCTDNSGNPIGLERFCFDPVQVLKEISKDEYKTFMMYMLEYKILVLEQLATIQEQKNILLSQTAPYGCILHCRIFRDFTGFGVGHIGYEGRTVITWILEIAVDNYPELLHRSHMINVPWIFNTIWYFVKGMLDENTIKKITINGTEFMQTLKKEVTLQNIPEVLGGTYKGGNDMYAFDISTATSPFYYPGCNRSSTYRKGIAANVTVTDDFSSVYQSLHTLHVSPTTTSSSDRTGNNDSNVDALLSKWTNDTITGSSSDVASPLVTKVFHDSESSTGAAAVAAGDGLDSEEQRLLDAALLARRKKKKAEKRRRAAADAEAVIKSEMRCTLVSLQKGCIFPGLFG